MIKRREILAQKCERIHREFARERWTLTVALSVPVALVLFASAIHKYPFGGRLLLFLVPLAVLAVASGAWAVFDALWAKNRFAAVTLLGLIVGAGAWQTGTAAISQARCVGSPKKTATAPVSTFYPSTSPAPSA